MDGVGAVLSLDELDALAEQVGGAFVVVVQVTQPNRPAVLPGSEPARCRRRVFLAAAAAERAVRAAQTRGEASRVYLAELTPLYRVRGGEGR